MTWPPTTHQHVQDEVGALRTTTVLPRSTRALASIGTSPQAARADHAHTGVITHALRPGMWTASNPESPTTSAAASVAGLLTLMPVYVPRSLTFDRWYVHMTAVGTAGVIRFVVYDDDGTTYPGALLADLGTTPQTANTELASSLAVESGLLWVGVVLQGNGTAPTLRTNTTANIVLAGNFTPSAGVIRSCYTLDNVTDAPPATYPALGSVGQSAGQHAPRVGMRVAA